MSRLNEICYGPLEDVSYYLDQEDLPQVELRAAIQRVIQEVRRMKDELAKSNVGRRS